MNSEAVVIVAHRYVALRSSLSQSLQSADDDDMKKTDKKIVQRITPLTWGILKSLEGKRVEYQIQLTQGVYEDVSSSSSQKGDPT